MAGNPKLKGYFKPVTWRSWFGLTLGVILTPVIVGLPIFLLCLINILLKSGSGGDSAADIALRDYREWVRKRAHEKTMIDDDPAGGETSAETLVLSSFHTNQLHQVTPGIIVSKKDGGVRFNPVTITVLIFGRDQLATYQTAVDLCQVDTYFGERMEEYFYNDVIGVRNEEQSWVRSDNGAEHTTKTQNVSLVVSSGDTVSVTISIDETKRSESEAWKRYASGMQPQINNIKRLLRERKTAQLGGGSPSGRGGDPF